MCIRDRLSGLSDMLAGLRDPERYGGRFVDRFAGSALVPTGVAQIARTLDPTARKTDGMAEYIQSRIPGLSDNLMPKRDVWGREMVNEGGVGPDIMSPIWTSTEKGDPATWEAIRVGATVNAPKDDDSLSPQQMDRWRMLSGQTAHEWVGELIKESDYRGSDIEGQQKSIAHIMKAAREAAKANVLSATPIPSIRPVKGQRRQRRPANIPPPPAGFRVEPPPSGFVLE